MTRQLVRVRPSRATSRDGAAGHPGEEVVEVAAGGVEGAVLVEGAQVLGEPPGDADLAVGVAVLEPGPQPPPGIHGQPVGPAAQHPPDAVQRVVAVPAAMQGLLLHAVADLIDHREAEVDDVERVEHTDGVRQLGTQRGGVPAERIERSEGDLLAPGCLPGCSGRPTERPGQLRRWRLPDNRRLHRSQLLSGLSGKVASGKGNGRGPARSLGTGHRACVRVGPCQRRRRVNNPLDLKESRGST